MTAKKVIDDTELRKALLELERRKKYQKIDFFEPFPKQKEFFAMGATYPERLFRAGNQLGKSEACAYEATCHMTGLYPEWWTGKRFESANRSWLIGESSLAVRDVIQAKLCGPPGVDELFGTGMIPKHLFVGKPTSARGIGDYYDTIRVRHKDGGISAANLKTYEQGREKLQGATLNWVWLDEEPDEDIYMECLTRISATKGMVFMSFTPMKGPTALFERFGIDGPSDCGQIVMTIDDVPMSPEEYKQKLERYPKHLRGAKLFGEPLRGEGSVFPVSEDVLSEEAFPAPSYWPRIWGIDFGIGHPFGAVLLAWDRDADCIHVLHTIRMKDARPLEHAKAMKAFGAGIPVAWPRDGTNRDQGSGEPLAGMYKAEGLKMLPDYATHKDGGVSTEAGIEEMLSRMVNGQFKVASHLKEWWEEFRGYHRKNGLVVKERDDLMSATRIGVMMKRFAKVSGAIPFGSAERAMAATAKGVELEHWGA